MSELEVTRVMSDLRGLYERGKLSDEQIARLDAIGFNWERQKRIKPTLDSRLAELWDEEKNGAVELVRLKQRDRYWWKCPICGCEWSRELGTALKASKENSMPDFSLSFPRRFPESMSGESGMAGRSGADVVVS